MNYIGQIAKEILGHLRLIYNLSIYEVRSKYKMHYLGVFWQFVTPLVQIVAYWLVFGLGIRGGQPIGEVPFFLWFIVGKVPWLFISPSLTQGAKSVYTKVGSVSKMNFPVSTLPVIKIVVNSFTFIPLLLLVILVLLFNGVLSGHYLLQLPYYLLALYILLYSVSLLTSTITTIIRDIQTLIQSIMRLMMFSLPILWNVESLPNKLVKVLQLNPFFYVVKGFRDSLLGGTWFFEDMSYTIYFWLATLFILLIGSYMHIRFRHEFVDYL